MRVLHVITRMIVGGAQENTMLSCALVDPVRFPSVLLTGPETGVEGELHGEAAARGVTVRVEPHLVRRLSPWHDLRALWRIYRLLRRERFDVVHTHSSKAGILGRLAARLAGVPIVVHTVHGWSFNDHQPRYVRALYVQLERWCAPLASALVVVGTPDQAAGVALGIGRPDQYELIRSGIEIEAYRDVALDRAGARERLGLPAEAFVFGSVGRLGEQKSPLDLLRAFERVAGACPGAQLVYVGDGPQRNALIAAIERAGLAGRVHLAGLRRDVPELLRAFDVFVLASRWEGLPRVFPQAMAAGLPIVATRVDGAPDAVIPGETGWLVEVGDVEGLARRMTELANDGGTAARMGAAGRARVDPFSATRMVRQLEALYTRLAEERWPG
ncbi:MAG: glycosyltransferase family 4 protein [Candidatus Eisenbacteria bacterium]|nr:glycosyltransferase family 4 protein [Candidatus Eisenbacteria bacterium]